MADIDNLVVTVGGDISGLQAAFDEIPDAAQAAASAVQNAFAGQDDLFSDIGAQAQAAFAEIPDAATQAAAEVADAFAGQDDLFSGIDDQAQAAFDEIPAAADEAAQATEESFAGIGDTVGQSFQQLGEAATSAGVAVTDAFEGSSNALAELPSEAQAAAAALSQVGDASNETAQSVDALQSALGDLPAAIDSSLGTATQEANAAGEAIGTMGTDVDDVYQGLGQLAGAMSSVAQSADEVKSNVEEIPPALHDVEDETENATEKFQEFLEQGLELAGIALSIEAIKEALTECVEAFAEFQRAGEALTVLAGDAKEASEALEQIPELASKIGQSIPDLESATVQFAKYGVELGTIPGLLTSISDAARSSLQSFDSVASSFERMDNTGKVMARSLQAAGLSMGDLANAMNMIGATDAEVTKAFAELGTGAEGASARAEVLIDATQRFAGISAQTANDVTGSWQQMANALHEASVNIGNSIAIIGGPGGVDVFKLLVQGIETFVISLIGYVQQATDIIVGLGKVAVSVFMSIGQAAAAAAQGDWTTAWQKIEDGWTAVGVDVQQTTQKMAEDWTANGKIIDSVWATTTANVEANTHQHIQGVVSDLATVQAALDKFADQAINVLNQIPATEDVYLTQLQNGGEKATQMLTQINQALATAMKDMATLSLTPAQIAGLQAFIDQLNQAKVAVQGFIDTDALEKLGTQVGALADKFSVQLSELDPAIQEWVKQMTTFSQTMQNAAQNSDPTKLLANLLETQKAYDDMATSMQKSWQAGTDAQTTATNKMLQDIGAFTPQVVSEVQSIGKNWMDVAATVTTSGAQQAVVYAALKALKIDDIGLDQQQETALNAVLAIMQRMGAPLNEQLGVQAQILQDQLKIGAAQGATAQQTLAWTEQLQNVQTQMNVLKDQTNGLSNLYTGMVKALGTAWTDLGKGLGDALVSGQNFGAAMTTVFDNLKKQIAELVTQYLLNQLKDAFLQNTDAVNAFSKVFNAIFGGGAGGGGMIASGFQAASQNLDQFESDMNEQVKNIENLFGDAGDSVKNFATTSQSSMQSASASVTQSANQMVSGLSAVASVVSAIASIFSAIELAHTNTLLDRIEHETARMAIYLGDSGSNSIQFYTGKTAEYLSYVHDDIVTIRDAVVNMNTVLQSILGAIVSGGGIGGGSGSGGAALQQLIQQLSNDMSVLSDQVQGPYGLGSAVQGLASSAGDASTGLASLDTVTSTLGSTLTATSATVTAASTAVANSMQAIVKATPVPATVAYSPGTNTFTPILPTASVPSSGQSGPGGSNALTPLNSIGSAGQAVIVNVQTNITPGVVAMNNNAQIQQFSDLVSKNVVTKLQQVGGQKIR